MNQKSEQQNDSLSLKTDELNERFTQRSDELQSILDGQLVDLGDDINSLETTTNQQFTTINNYVSVNQQNIESLQNSVNTLTESDGSIRELIEQEKVAREREDANLNDSLTQVFTYVSDGKNDVASAITDCGVDTASDATFQTMSDNIRLIYANAFREGMESVSSPAANIEYERHHHEGSSTAGTGCYTTPVYKKHTHNSSCYRACNSIIHVSVSTNRTGANGTWWYQCPACLWYKAGGSWSSGHEPDYPDEIRCEGQIQMCGKTAGYRYANEGIDYYDPGCGYNEGQILSAKIIFSN